MAVLNKWCELFCVMAALCILKIISPGYKLNMVHGWLLIIRFFMLLNVWSVRNFGGCFLLKKSKWAWPKFSRSINLLSHHVGLHHNNYLPLYSCYLLGHKVFVCFLVEEASHANSILDLGLWGVRLLGKSVKFLCLNGSL